MDCKKRVFETHAEANKALEIIKAYPDYKQKSKKEQRAYTCPFCGKVHLTSISQKENELHKKEMQERRQKRIEKVASYWEQKLGIKKEI